MTEVGLRLTRIEEILYVTNVQITAVCCGAVTLVPGTLIVPQIFHRNRSPIVWDDSDSCHSNHLW